jgi:LacI family transcriptional regulator
MSATMKSTGRVTLADIARDLGLSKAAVSKALRGDADISERTRQRVLDRARELDYRSNWMAVALRSHSTRLVGIVVPTFLHSFFAEVIEASTRILDDHGFGAVITTTGETPMREVKEIELLLSRRVDGLLVATCQSFDAGAFQSARRQNVPVVFLGRNINPAASAYVACDNVAIGRIATRHLIAYGRKTIAYLAGPPNSTSASRHEGYRSALKAARLETSPNLVAGGHEDESVVQTGTRLLLSRPQRPDGIFCYNDPVAAACLRTILECGLRVPEDVAVIGVGNTRYSDLLRVPLTTIDQDAAEIGRRGALMLLDMLGEKNAGTPELVPFKLIVRESCGARLRERAAAHNS